MHSRPHFILFGDSITQFSFQVSNSGVGPGWGALLAEFYETKVDIINRGYSGYNARWALSMLDSVFGANSNNASNNEIPQLVTIFFGANDCATNQQHIDLAEYRANLHTMIHRIVAIAKAKHNANANVSSDAKSGKKLYIVLITPPAINEEAWLESGRKKFGTKCEISDRLNATAGEYARACIEVAKYESEQFASTTEAAVAAAANGLSVEVLHLDIWTAMLQQPDWKSFHSDGLHLSAEGNRFVYEQLKQLISSSARELLPENIHNEYIPWRQFLPASPATTRQQ